ncbi:MAG: hypothetical protein LBF66_02455 [Holosporales bacterium]|jgi:hypothetical protein|nr:hypothetical protein [Holosporales bacterium]
MVAHYGAQLILTFGIAYCHVSVLRYGEGKVLSLRKLLIESFVVAISFFVQDGRASTEAAVSATGNLFHLYSMVLDSPNWDKKIAISGSRVVCPLSKLLTNGITDPNVISLSTGTTGKTSKRLQDIINSCMNGCQNVDSIKGVPTRMTSYASTRATNDAWLGTYPFLFDLSESQQNDCRCDMLLLEFVRRKIGLLSPPPDIEVPAAVYLMVYAFFNKWNFRIGPEWDLFAGNARMAMPDLEHELTDLFGPRPDTAQVKTRPTVEPVPHVPERPPYVGELDGLPPLEDLFQPRPKSSGNQRGRSSYSGSGRPKRQKSSRNPLSPENFPDFAAIGDTGKRKKPDWGQGSHKQAPDVEGARTAAAPPIRGDMGRPQKPPKVILSWEGVPLKTQAKVIPSRKTGRPDDYSEDEY